eukprot:scaffold11045_cov138-Skeletonema_menzelii.AAC.8
MDDNRRYKAIGMSTRIAFSHVIPQGQSHHALNYPVLWPLINQHVMLQDKRSVCVKVVTAMMMTFQFCLLHGKTGRHMCIPAGGKLTSTGFLPDKPCKIMLPYPSIQLCFIQNRKPPLCLDDTTKTTLSLDNEKAQLLTLTLPLLAEQQVTKYLKLIVA